MKGYIKHIGIGLSVLCMVFLSTSCEKDKLIDKPYQKSENQASVTTILSDDFESGLGKWVIWGPSPLWMWTIGSAYTIQPGAYSAYIFSGGSSRDSYSYLRLNQDISGYTNLSLSFYFYNRAYGNYGNVDYLYVEYSIDGTNYYQITSFTSEHSSWALVSDLSIPENTRYIRFAAYCREGGGIGLDNVVLKGMAR